MLGAIKDLGDGETFDVIVAGSGAAGLAAATFAAIRGQRVLVLERTEFFGGTTALSASTIWAPGTPHGRTVNATDTPEQALRFLDGTVGNHAARAMRQAFIEAAPRAIAALEAHTSLQFRPFIKHPDYEQEIEGATLSGRAIEPLPFDGRLLGPLLDKIRPPIPEFTIFGGMMVDRTDINHLLGLKRSRASLLHATRILARYGRDRLGGRRRGSRLLMGNALIGRFLKSLTDRAVTLMTDTEITDISRDDRGVTAIVVESQGQRRTLKIKRALVLAGGGFNRNARQRAALLPAVETHSPAAPGHTGALQDLAITLGARFGDGEADSAFWAAVSIRRRSDGSTAVFPHFVLDRSKPGTLCVDGTGQRFVNESTSYHNFARAMIANTAHPTGSCYIITDARGLSTYGLGMVRMGTRNLRPFIADGYLTEAQSLDQLAQALTLPAAALRASVEEINEAARTGHDPRFGRGATAYHRHNGDGSHLGPNPTLGALATAPYYAVRLYPGDIGAAKGLDIDPWARVLGRDGFAIARLYACGNEAQSIMGGVYPGPGITLGPAIAFAYRAMEDALKGDA